MIFITQQVFWNSEWVGTFKLPLRDTSSAQSESRTCCTSWLVALGLLHLDEKCNFVQHKLKLLGVKPQKYCHVGRPNKINLAPQHTYNMLILLSSGSNARGQLGHGTLDDSHLFQKCSFDGYSSGNLPSGTTRVVDIAAGANHTILLLELACPTGGHRLEVWGSGDGRRGQLGSKYQREPTPTLFRNLELPIRESGLDGYSFKFIAATWETSYIVLCCDGRDDLVISMGSDDYGDLGIGGLESFQGMGQPLRKNFNVLSFDGLFCKETSTANDGHIVVDAITAGQRHVILSLRVAVEGKSSFEQVLVGWGMSRHGQLGPSTSSNTKPPSKISAPQNIAQPLADDPVTASSLGMHHSVLLHTSGNISALGSDRKGQLQVASKIKNVGDISCTWNGTYCTVRDNKAWSILSSGSNTHGQLGRETGDSPSAEVVNFPLTLDNLDTSVHVVCGSEHVLALIRTSSPNSGHKSPEVWGWGWNEHGNLGLGHTEDVRFPVRIWSSKNEVATTRIRSVHGVWAGCGTSWICFQTDINIIS
jgi:protein ATS1